jgi:hypothetical protein
VHWQEVAAQVAGVDLAAGQQRLVVTSTEVAVMVVLVDTVIV